MTSKKTKGLKLSICIVTDSQLQKSRSCLKSIYRHRPDCDFEIIFLDNASVNSIHKMVEKEFPDVRLIINDRKHSFGHNYNKTLRLAKGRFVLILNDDTEILDDAINRSLSFMKSRNDVGILGAQQLLPDGNILRSCSRSFPTLETYTWEKLFMTHLFPRSRRFSKLYYGNWDKKDSRQVDQVSGAFMLVRKEIIDELGGFDENISFYYEDTDLCRRITDAGWRIWYAADCQILHHHGSSLRTRIRSRAKIEEFRSAVYYFKKYDELENYNLMKLLDIVHNISKVALFLPVDRSSSRAILEVVKWHFRNLSLQSVLDDRM